MVRPRRQRPPSLLGTAARTAVVAGTAASVSGSVAANQRAAEAQKQQLAAAQAQAQQAAIDEAAARAVAAQQVQQPVPAAASAPADPLAQLERLAQLHERGLLSADEFAAAKAKLLGL